jgi:hypothetical protein
MHRCTHLARSRIHREIRGIIAALPTDASQIARDMGKARQQIQPWIKRFGI